MGSENIDAVLDTDEFIVVADNTSEVVFSGTGPVGRAECCRMVQRIYKCGGAATVFQAVRGGV